MPGSCVQVAWVLDRATLVQDDNQKGGVKKNLLRLTHLADTAIRFRAFPVIAGIADVRVLRYFDGFAPFSLGLKPAITFPAGAIAGFG